MANTWQGPWSGQLWEGGEGSAVDGSRRRGMEGAEPGERGALLVLTRLWEGGRAEDAPITPAHQPGVLFSRDGTENTSGIVAVVWMVWIWWGREVARGASGATFLGIFYFIMLLSLPVSNFRQPGCSETFWSCLFLFFFFPSSQLHFDFLIKLLWLHGLFIKLCNWTLGFFCL